MYEHDLDLRFIYNIRYISVIDIEIHHELAGKIVDYINSGAELIFRMENPGEFKTTTVVRSFKKHNITFMYDPPTRINMETYTKYGVRVFLKFNNKKEFLRFKLTI